MTRYIYLFEFNPGLSLSGNPPDGTEDVAYSFTFTASGGTQPYSWSVIDGSLPSGLSLNSSTGEISGTPTSSGSFDFTVEVEDSLGATAEREFAVAIAQGTSVVTEVTHPGVTTAGTGIILIDARRMGDTWWDTVQSDGSDVRVRDSGGTVHPHVLRGWGPGRGTIVAEVPLGTSATTFDVVVGNDGISAAGGSVGTGYDHIWDFEEATDIVGGAGLSVATLDGSPYPPQRLWIMDWGDDVNNAHQGVAFDGTHFYITDNSAIYKYDTDWTLVTSNTSPFSSLPVGTDHLDDPTIYDGELWVTCNGQFFVIYNLSDLSFNRKIDFSGFGGDFEGTASITIHNDMAYVPKYNDNSGDSIHVFNLDGSYDSEITVNLLEMQGIERAWGLWWVVHEVNSEKRISAFDDTWTEVTWWGSPAIEMEEAALRVSVYAPGIATGVQEVEGLYYYDNTLYCLVDHGDTSHVYSLDFSAAMSTFDHDTFSGALEASVARDTTQTVEFEFYRLERTAQRCIVSVTESATSTVNARSSVTIDNGNNYGTWESTGAGWLYSSVNPTAKTWHHGALVHDGSQRRLYLNGTEYGPDSADLPATVDSILFGTNDWDNNEPYFGAIRNARYRSSAASASDILFASEAAQSLTYTPA